MIIKNCLICHEAAACTAVKSLHVEIETLPNKNLLIRYILAANLAQLRIPEPMPPEFTDGLWEHTCFEAFIGVAGEKDYHEFNFSPSGQWAAFAFSDYRLRRQWTASQPSRSKIVVNHKRLQMETLIEPVNLPANPLNKPFQLGLTAVVETIDGSRSYWALHHPGVRPDFHHRGGFVQPVRTI